MFAVTGGAYARRSCGGPEGETFVTAQQVALALGIDSEAVEALVASGRLVSTVSAIRTGAPHRFRWDDLLRYLELSPTATDVTKVRELLGRLSREKREAN